MKNCILHLCLLIVLGHPMAFGTPIVVQNHQALRTPIRNLEQNTWFTLKDNSFIATKVISSHLIPESTPFIFAESETQKDLLYCHPSFKEGPIKRLEIENKCWSSENLVSQIEQNRQETVECPVAWEKSKYKLVFSSPSISASNLKKKTWNLKVIDSDKIVEIGRVSSVDFFDFNNDQYMDFFLDRR